MQKQPRPLKPILEYALAILARREHSVTEVRRKLTTKGYPKTEVAQTIEQLLQKNYLNDVRYAEVRARTRAHHSKWGEGRIKQELAQNGVAKETTQSTLSELSETEDWLATATKLLQRKFTKPIPTLRNLDPALNKADAYKEINKEKSRRIAFLTRRGFTMSQSLKALGLSQEDLEEFPE